MSTTTPSSATDFLPMHPLELQVLLVLLQGGLHGYGIAKEIERSGAGLGRIQPTNLYRRLRDMAEKGMISEETHSPGEPRRLFRITPFGEEVARAEAERLEDLVFSARRQGLLPSRAREG